MSSWLPHLKCTLLDSSVVLAYAFVASDGVATNYSESTKLLFVPLCSLGSASCWSSPYKCDANNEYLIGCGAVSEYAASGQHLHVNCGGVVKRCLLLWYPVTYLKLCERVACVYVNNATAFGADSPVSSASRALSPSKQSTIPPSASSIKRPLPITTTPPAGYPYAVPSIVPTKVKFHVFVPPGSTKDSWSYSNWSTSTTVQQRGNERQLF